MFVVSNLLKHQSCYFAKLEEFLLMSRLIVWMYVYDIWKEEWVIEDRIFRIETEAVFSVDKYQVNLAEFVMIV